MQTLRYPIVMFVITALAVIGIGVGIVAATTNQNVYGPSWGRFTASFPGHVDVAHSGSVTSASSNDPARYTSTFYYANQPFNGWVAYAPLSNSVGGTAISPFDLRAVIVTEVANNSPGSESAVRDVANPRGGYLSSVRAHNHERTVNGLREITLGPVCSYRPRRRVGRVQRTSGLGRACGVERVTQRR
jgi:hypothetical protein